MFYPARRDDLERVVRTFIEGSGMSPDDSVTGLVSPHAGYVYSGAVAGAAYASAPDDVETVVVLAPPHRFPVRGASVFDGDGYATPLGEAPVNRSITEALLKAGYSFQPEAHMSEHSAEVQVPFIQVRWSGVRIAVILQGDSSPEFSRELAGAVAGSCEHTGRLLVVASSDLSHYHSLRVAREKDRMMIEAFKSGDPSRMEDAAAAGGEACGKGPIITLMHYAHMKGCSRFGEIRWTTSADASGDSSSVVGYFAGYCGDGGGCPS